MFSSRVLYACLARALPSEEDADAARFDSALSWG